MKESKLLLMTWGGVILVVAIFLIASVVALRGSRETTMPLMEEIDETQAHTNALLATWENIFRRWFSELAGEGRLTVMHCASRGEGFIFFALALPPITDRHCDVLAEERGPEGFLDQCQVVAWAHLIDGAFPARRQAVCCERLVNGQWQNAMSLVPDALKRAE